MFATTPQTFQPTMDQDHSTVTIEMVPGSTYQQAGAVVRQVEALLRQQPEVDSCSAGSASAARPSTSA